MLNKISILLLFGVLIAAPCSLAIDNMKYAQNKDDDIRSVRECKSFQRYRPSCTKTLIVGGNKTEPKEFPIIASLFYKEYEQIRRLCGGTLISNKYVLTAAHCFYHAKLPTTVRLGELDWSTTTDDAQHSDYAIKNIITHPQYFTSDIQDYYNDIALVELADVVEFNDYILPACLPLLDGREFDEYLAFGWEYTNDTTPGASKHMYKIKLDRIDHETCDRKIRTIGYTLENGLNNRTQMCAGSFKDVRYTCQGDTGNPLFVDHPDYNCMFLAVGITSFGSSGCDTPGEPSVYTRIQSYMEWIEQIVWSKAPALS